MSSVAELVIRRCQLLTGRFCEGPPGRLAPDIQDLVADLPSRIAPADQAVISSVLARWLARFAGLNGVDHRPEVSEAFVRLAGATPMFDGWRQEWLHAVDVCCTLLRNGPASTSGIVDSRVYLMLRTIECQHADPALNVRAVARAANVSPWHAARLLKQQTGSGFVAHLHRCRVRIGSRLLLETARSVKEVATRVGYRHQSQLTRQFKLAYGLPPTGFRHMGARITVSG